MKHILHNRKGVTVLEGLIALLLLSVVAVGTFGVLLSSSRKASTPDVREEMMQSVERVHTAYRMNSYVSLKSSCDTGYMMYLGFGWLPDKVKNIPAQSPSIFLKQVFQFDHGALVPSGHVPGGTSGGPGVCTMNGSDLPLLSLPGGLPAFASPGSGNDITAQAAVMYESGKAKEVKTGPAWKKFKEVYYQEGKSDEEKGLDPYAAGQNIPVKIFQVNYTVKTKQTPL